MRLTTSSWDKHPTDLAMLRGARLVTASETEGGRAFAEARIKQMTGGDPITARFMRKDFFIYRPAFKLMIVGNHKPSLRNVDGALRRRFNIIPFVHKPEAPDPDLEAKLRQEWPNILRWMIEGCLDWRENRLVRPQSVMAATESYFSEQDLFGQWLAEERDVDPGNEYKWGTTAELYSSWSTFANRSGEKPGSVKAFSETMHKRGFEPQRTSRSRGFAGLRRHELRRAQELLYREALASDEEAELRALIGRCFPVADIQVHRMGPGAAIWFSRAMR